MSDLRQLAQPLLDRPPLEPTPVAELRRRARRNRARRGALVTVLVTTAIVLIGGLVVTRNDSQAPTVNAGPPGPSAPTTRPSAVPVSTLEVGGATDVAIGAGSVWVPGFEVVRRIDPIANAVAATIPVAGSSDYRSVAIAFGSVWVTDTGTGDLTRIDPTTNQVVATIHLSGSPTRMASANGQLWVVVPEPNQPGGGIVPVDPVTNRAGQPLAVSATVPAPFVALASSGDTLFAAWGTELLAIDTRARSIRSVRTTSDGAPHGDDPISVTVASGRLYVVKASGRVVELDLPKLSIRTTSAPIRSAQQLAYGTPNQAQDGPSLWLLTQPSSEANSQLLRLDPTTLQPLGRPIETGLTSVAVAADADTTWVANFNQGTLTRLDAHNRSARPELCAATVPLDRINADGLPPVDAVITDRTRAEQDLQSAEADLHTRFPNATSFTIGPGYGRAWTRDAQGRVTVLVVHDFAVIAQLRSPADCPTTPAAPVGGTTTNGLPILLAK